MGPRSLTGKMRGRLGKQASVFKALTMLENEGLRMKSRAGVTSRASVS